MKVVMLMWSGASAPLIGVKAIGVLNLLMSLLEHNSVLVMP